MFTCSSCNIVHNWFPYVKVIENKKSTKGNLNDLIIILQQFIPYSVLNTIFHFHEKLLTCKVYSSCL